MCMAVCHSFRSDQQKGPQGGPGDGAINLKVRTKSEAYFMVSDFPYKHTCGPRGRRIPGSRTHRICGSRTSQHARNMDGNTCSNIGGNIDDNMGGKIIGTATWTATCPAT